MTTLTDLSQLTKSMVKRSVEEPKPAPTPKAQDSPVDSEAAEVLAYFARPGGNAPRRAHVASRADPAKDRVAELEAALEAKDAALDAFAEEKATMDERIADLERRLAEEREAHAAAVRERDRLQGECGRLQGELRKTADNGPVAPLIATPSGQPSAGGYSPAQAAPVAQAEPTKPTRGLLAANGAIAEAFPGEVREQVLAALADAPAYPPGRRPAAKRAATRGADVIVFGTPAYFYSCTGQLKVLFDRTVAIYPDLPNKQYYYLLAQGDENKDTFAGTIKSLDGFLDCYEGSKFKGMVAPRIAPA